MGAATPGGNHHDSFELVETTSIASLNLDVEHYVHKDTGAVHYHLASDNTEKVFLVAVRTMPKDSTGVAHILEHTALCGSEKYPVRDPFFMMTRRSLNTFMNAMTSSDWTAYPFASQNQKDFDNLLSVYLDAVFFARLDELDFAQEGHRVEFEEEGNQNSPLVFKGVVFNEMKGAMSSPVSQLWQGVSRHLFPTTTYHHNSGGEPSDITDLTYEQLVSFYKSHYHPSNSIFMTFGDMDIAETQQSMHEQALTRFERQSQRWEVPHERRMAAPVRIEEAYAVDSEEAVPQDKTHHVMGWLLGESADLKHQLECHLMSQVLLDNSASPLRKALEKCEFATSPSPMCGLEDSNREMTFLCGVEGSNPDDAARFEQMVFDVLTEIAEKGADQSMIDSAMHQLEFHQREIGGDHYPYGLQLIFSGLSSATHYGDPVAMLNLDPALEALKDDIRQPDFFSNLIRRNLLDNRHYVRFTMRPDNGYADAEQKAETAKLERIRSSLSDDDKQSIIQQAEDLKERQQQEDDGSILPSVTLEDVPKTVPYPQPDNAPELKDNITGYTAGANGIVYQQIIADLPEVSSQEAALLPLLSYAWTETGVKGSGYLEQQQKQAALCGGLSSYSTIKTVAESADNSSWLSYYTMSGKALASNINAFSDLIEETWEQADFSDQERITDLLDQLTARKIQGITGNGHGLAMQIASAGVNEKAARLNQLSGLPLINTLRDIQKAGGSELTGKLSDLHQKICQQSREVLIVQDSEHLSAHLASVKRWQDEARNGEFRFSDDFTSEHIGYWMTDTQVNFCSQAFPTVNQLHPDAPALSVAAGILRNGFLHTAIREQGGAYGAGASQDSSTGVFRFYSYRDPRVEGTFDDFEASVKWLIDSAMDEALVEQSILGIIGSMDRPSSPAGEARMNHHALKAGRTDELRSQYRASLLSVTLSDVKRVAAQYLDPSRSAKGVVAPKGTASVAENLGLKTTEV